ncbi:MAG TPA: dTDP-glucose 4,6-dehydratase [Candidatus Sulfotelmatobacter sp.]|jgi:dTDP-glucose 4,6-dehydratase|nr:dTDP-glucose 4,6-dehydratase [Candidatus Sulfotelmatobacter sp.]
MKILVTGGAGFIGSNFIRYTLKERKDFSIVNYDKLTYAGNLANLESVADHPNYEFVKGDICDATAVETAMSGCDAVIHFAAESHVDRSIYEPAPVIQTNVTGTFTLIEMARKTSVSLFVHVSTDEVYGDIPPGVFADESFPLRPSSPYSASKAASDLLVQSYVRTYKFPAVITRSSNNYGPYQFPEKLVPLMITTAYNDQALPVYGDGKQQRDWLHVEDNCRGILSVLEKGRIGQVYNIGGLDLEENLALVRRILKLTEKSESLVSHVQDRPGHDRRYALNCKKIETELDWRPAISLEDGLRRTIDWYKNHGDWLAGVRSREYLSYYEKYYENRESSLRAIAGSGSMASD